MLSSTFRKRSPLTSGKTKAIRLLLVDDHEVVRIGLRSVLNNNRGISVVGEAGTKVAAVRAVKRLRPDIILMDVILPDVNGREIVHQLQKDPATAKIPIIFTTNTLSLEVDDGNQVFEVDHVKYRAFAKPLHYRKLLSAIHKEINRSIHGGDLPPPK